MIQPPPLPIDKTAPWRALAAHASAVRQRHLRDLFAADAGRFTRFSFRCGDLLLDLSRQRLEDETLRLLLELAGEADVLRWRDRMLAGEKINLTENRAVLHTALRRSEEHTSELQSLMRISYAVYCLKKKKQS